VAERPARERGVRRLVAVAALTAVLGGVAGGGTVALLDRDDTATPVAGAGLSVDPGSAPAAATTGGTTEAAAATALRSVVTLNVTGAQESGTGSGVVIRADGYILTNQHVVAAAENGGSITATLPDGRTVPATIVGTDTVTDLAVVKVSASGLTAATFADSDAVRIGQTVVAVGSPLGLDGTVTEGIVSALHRPTTGGSDNSAVIDALQTDAAINPGNSGGPLVDLAGRVVGINQSIATASSGGGPGQSGSSGNIGIGFAIPSDTAARVAEQLITTGKATHAYLGVQAGGSGSTATPGAGATLASVESGGPAAAAGLEAGDVVTKIDDRVVDSSDELVAAVRSHAPGDKVTLTIRRGTAEQTVRVTLGSDDRQ
jgi:putative serine protease PepD